MMYEPYDDEMPAPPPAEADEAARAGDQGARAGSPAGACPAARRGGGAERTVAAAVARGAQAPARVGRRPAHPPGLGRGSGKPRTVHHRPARQAPERSASRSCAASSASPTTANTGRRAPGSSKPPTDPRFWYDEWDYHIDDYRSRWCRLFEIGLDGDSGEFFTNALSDYAPLIPEVRRQFQRIRPEMYRTVRGLEDGEDFDLNAAIARPRRRARRGGAVEPASTSPASARSATSPTLFLVDMSASTDEPLDPLEAPPDRDTTPPRGAAKRSRRIIDVTKETLVIMAQALEEIGDAYAIYGFSGHGRENVEIYRVKSFAESLTTAVKARLGGIEPKRSTRMGTALRHAIEKMSGVTARCQAPVSAQRRLSAGLRLRTGPAQQRLRDSRYRGRSARSGKRRHHALLHHRRQGGA